MKRKKDCLYTSMLNRLTMLDEQVCEMQAHIAMVREWVADHMNESDKEPTEHEHVRTKIGDEGES